MNVPFILRFQNTLLALRTYLQTTQKISFPCIYTDKNSVVYVIINNVLNQVTFTKGSPTPPPPIKQLKPLSASPIPPTPPTIQYNFTPITGQALSTLIQNGLYLISFKNSMICM